MNYNFKTKSLHEFINVIENKSDDLKLYINVLHKYMKKLNSISIDSYNKIKLHENKIKELETNNYKIPELNLIKDKLNKIIITEEDDDFNTFVKLIMI